MRARSGKARHAPLEIAAPTKCQIPYWTICSRVHFSTAMTSSAERRDQQLDSKVRNTHASNEKQKPQRLRRHIACREGFHFGALLPMLLQSPREIGLVLRPAAACPTSPRVLPREVK